LRREFHGKEGVDGSSPSEGSAKAQRNGVFCFGSTCRCSNVGQVWSPLWSLQVENEVLESRVADRGALRRPPTATGRSSFWTGVAGLVVGCGLAWRRVRQRSLVQPPTPPSLPPPAPSPRISRRTPREAPRVPSASAVAGRARPARSVSRDQASTARADRTSSRSKPSFAGVSQTWLCVGEIALNSIGSA
jgi:hypothetical protein